MNASTLSHFRKLADIMQGDEPRDWQWVGRWESQRMFGITEKRARDYAAKHGGSAEKMVRA